MSWYESARVSQTCAFEWKAQHMSRELSATIGIAAVAAAEALAVDGEFADDGDDGRCSNV